MKYRVLTISREFGSGGAEIGAIAAGLLGWRLVDGMLLEAVASRASMPLSEVSQLDEHVDPWLYRVLRPALYAGVDGISLATASDGPDADAVAALTKEMIERVGDEGQCVIVGRGVQCVLHNRPGVFHVFAYASWADRMKRASERAPQGGDLARYIHKREEERTRYVRCHFGADRFNPHLYDLMINTSACKPEKAARLIVAALESA